jgi:hypothetical protein
MSTLKRGTARMNGELLRELAARRGWQLQELDRKLGYGQRTIQKWLAGGRAQISAIANVAETFGIHPQMLMPDLQPPISPPPSPSVSVAPTSGGMSVSLQIADLTATPEDFAYLCKLLARAMDDYAEYKKSKDQIINIYFVPGTDSTGQRTYSFCVIDASLDKKFFQALEAGYFPNFAVIVESGYGVPSEAVKAKMKRYFDFDLDEVLASPGK